MENSGGVDGGSSVIRDVVHFDVPSVVVIIVACNCSVRRVCLVPDVCHMIFWVQRPSPRESLRWYTMTTSKAVIGLVGRTLRTGSRVRRILVALASPHAFSFLALMLCVCTRIGQSQREVLDRGELRSSILPAAFNFRVVSE